MKIAYNNEEGAITGRGGDAEYLKGYFVEGIGWGLRRGAERGGCNCGPEERGLVVLELVSEACVVVRPFPADKPRHAGSHSI